MGRLPRLAEQPHLLGTCLLGPWRRRTLSLPGEGRGCEEARGSAGLDPAVRGDIHLPQGLPCLPQAPEAPRKLGRAPQ